MILDNFHNFEQSKICIYPLFASTQHLVGSQPTLPCTNSFPMNQLLNSLFFSFNNFQMNQSTYGFLNIYYGSTSGNSKRMAEDFKDQAKSKGFLPLLCNLGDFTPERFFSNRLVILFVSTYGQGGPTEDAENFLKCLESLNAEGKPLQQMRFVIFGLGNSTFEFFCGMPKKVRKLLMELGAREVLPMHQCDAKLGEPHQIYLQWKKPILGQLIETLNLEKIEISIEELKALTKQFNMKMLPDQLQNWDEKDYEHLNLNFEIKKYLRAQKAEVLEIKEIRNSTEGRSTLFVRIKTNSTNLSPACNVEIYPQNIIDQSVYQGSVEFSGNHLIPYPPLPVKTLMKIGNSSSKPPKSFLQQALWMCKTPQSLNRYQPLLDQPELWENSDLTSEDILKELDLGLQHRASLGINLPRVYTLAGWKPGEIQLIVSLFIVKGKMGLTSKYLQSMPKQLRIKVLSSSFYVPKDPQIPLVMIANGSGIAPFRSLLHYYMSPDAEVKAPPLYLYYGCQKQKEDYYFQEQWEEAEKKGIIKLNIATSREGEKQYVQALIKSNMEEFKTLLFEKKAIFFVCGSLSMDKDINNIFITAHKEAGLKPYIAMTKVKELQRDKRIVKEVYG